MKKEYSTEELDEMVKSFRISNIQHEITGAMVYCDRNVIQFVEGEEQSVVRLMNIISQDQRHNISITIMEDKVLRVFPDWTMGYKVSGLDNFMDIKNLLGNTKIEKVIKDFIQNN